MSSRGGFRGGSTPRGGPGGGGFPGGRGGGRGGYQHRDMGPPDEVLEMGSFVHAVEGDMLCQSINVTKVPYFNAPMYLHNKQVIGKVDEILGPINQTYFTIKMGEGMVASSFKTGDKVYIGGDKLLPIERFLPKPKVAGAKVEKRGRGGARGTRGGGRGASGRGFPRGGGRGGGRGGSFGGRGGAGGRGSTWGSGGLRGASRGRGRGFRGS